MYQKRVTHILKDISLQLDQLLKTDHQPGLLGGHTGCALFYAYYYQLTGKEEYLEKVHALILSSIEAMSSHALLPTHCNGIAGEVWCIQHLMNQGFVDGDMDEIFSEVDVLLGDQMIADLNNKRYDFLHEGLGIALYFLEKETPDPRLSEIAIALANTATHLPNGITWEDHFSRQTVPSLPDEPCYNLGMAHGMPAIVGILSRIKAKGIDAGNLVEKSLDWLLSVSNPPGSPSRYPTLVNNAGTALTASHSRMGWCYGDLPVAMTLLYGGYTNPAYEILAHSVQNRDVQNGIVHDTCICHGSAGIAHIFNRAYRETGEKLFQQGAEKWLQHTIDIYDSPAGIGFYGDGKYEIKEGVLEGVAGVGLALIAALDMDTEPAWDRCILLS
ncbi:lanthionine synthetase C family protein [Chitinophaga sp. LS1]|uniref:lanthionine synthetase C family protein n=1 Tax=Chitinophaga sp. LS1 TaxID=3051176 RepID=UPI002AAC3E09|nr:lanthionine synthetase C family protein [Chitinophaga sp. LS1]WPV69351.1 lanthionine synthetase C family protein [Chitinophaga sp. LS1]